MLAIITRPNRHTALALYLALALLVGAVLPCVANAELSSGGLGELASKAAQEEATKTATTATSEKRASETRTSALPSGLVILGVAAAAVLLGGIAFVIVRDARAVAPVVEGAPGGHSRDAEVKLRKRRAKAKAAKQQRKRNR